MKKVSTLLCGFIFIFASSLGVDASEIDSDVIVEAAKKQTKDLRLKKKISDFSEYTQEEELSNEEIENALELKKQIQEEVLVDNGEGKNPKARAGACQTTIGDVFVTQDGTTKGFAHGHAALGACTQDYTIEANPDDGVQLKHSMQKGGYWTAARRKSGVVMYVKNASYEKNKKAYNYAVAQKGEKYGFTLGSSTASWYCSELVYRAWHSQGKRIGSPTGEKYWDHRNIGFVAPIELMWDMDTVVYRNL